MPPSPLRLFWMCGALGCAPSAPTPPPSAPTPPAAAPTTWTASGPKASGTCSVQEDGFFSREARVRDCHPSELGELPIPPGWRLPATRVDLDVAVLADGTATRWMRLEGVPEEAPWPEDMAALDVAGDVFAWPAGWARLSPPDRQRLDTVKSVEAPSFWDLGREVGERRPGELRAGDEPGRGRGSMATGLLAFRDGERVYVLAWERPALFE